MHRKEKSCAVIFRMAFVFFSRAFETQRLIVRVPKGSRVAFLRRLTNRGLSRHLLDNLKGEVPISMVSLIQLFA
jgi:hypothetical protein